MWLIATTTAEINPRDPRLIKEIVVRSTTSYVMFSSFLIVFCSTILAEQKSRQRAEELSRQVESLATQLERVRIARDIHDSLGHHLSPKLSASKVQHTSGLSKRELEVLQSLLKAKIIEKSPKYYILQKEL